MGYHTHECDKETQRNREKIKQKNSTKKRTGNFFVDLAHRLGEKRYIRVSL